ncbi:MAG TPA: aldo/keto reductase, partial [Kiloniellales bacterium]
VALRWLVQQDGVIAIPRSSREAHAESNLAIFDFELTGPEMNEIFALGRSGGRLVDPLGVAPAWDDLEATGQVGRNVKRLVRAVGARLRRRLR